jgi:DNA-binding MarR family transcriptional regulator
VAEAAWLNKREERAWRGLLAMHAQLGAELARRLAAESPLSYQDYEVLVVLTDRPDSRLRVFELAEVLGWEKSRASHHLARMSGRGLIKKVPCPTDGRGSFVAATTKGRRQIEAAAPGHVAAVRELFVERLTPAQLDAIANAAENVLAPLAGRP